MANLFSTWKIPRPDCSAQFLTSWKFQLSGMWRCVSECSSHHSDASQCFQMVWTAPSEITSHPRKPESSAAPLIKPQISHSYLLLPSEQFRIYLKSLFWHSWNSTCPSVLLKKTADYRFQGYPCHSVLWMSLYQFLWCMQPIKTIANPVKQAMSNDLYFYAGWHLYARTGQCHTSPSASPILKDKMYHFIYVR
jgi:hypothetical protein